MNPILMAIEGSGVVHLLVVVLIVGIIAALIWAAGRWAIIKFAAPPVVMTIWNGLFMLIGLIIAINFLLGLIGKPLITW